MLKTLQKLMALLFKPEKEAEVVLVDDEKIKLRKELVEKNTELLALKKEFADSIEQNSLWMRKSSTLRNSLTTAEAHVEVLEGVLEESNKTIEALNLAIELREKEETEGLQNYIDELEAEIDEAVELITKYGLQLRKM